MYPHINLILHSNDTLEWYFRGKHGSDLHYINLHINHCKSVKQCPWSTDSDSKVQITSYLIHRILWLPLLTTIAFILFSWMSQWSHARSCVSLFAALRLDDHGFQVPGASLSPTEGHPPRLFQPHGCNQRLCERHPQHSQPGWRDVPTAHRGMMCVWLHSLCFGHEWVAALHVVCWGFP